MIRITLAAMAVSLAISGAAAAQDACDKLKGPEKAACMKAAKEAAGKTNMGRSEEMKGLGAQGKGQGAEKGQGATKDTTDEAKAMAKEKADKKVKDLKDQAKEDVKDKAKGKAADMLKKGGE